MRNPDPGPLRYTSLAWAAVCGNEDVFDYLLSNGHDDEELSKVRRASRIARAHSHRRRTPRTTPSSFSSPAWALSVTATTRTDHRQPISTFATPRSAWRAGIMSVTRSSWTGPTCRARPLCMLPRSKATRSSSEYVALPLLAVRRLDMKQTLCDVGADFDMPDAQGNTPLH